MKTLDKKHGRIEERSIWVSTRLNDYVLFPHCGQVAKIERVTKMVPTGKVRHETAYIVTSLSPSKASPERLMSLVRDHWSIENRSHWVRDVTYDEDRSQIRTQSGPRMMAILRNLAIGIIRFLGFAYIPAGIRHFGRRGKVLAALGL